jgi:hypothetical protein
VFGYVHSTIVDAYDQRENNPVKFLLFVILFPLLLIPLAAVGIHLMACDMHVSAVDGMRDKEASAERKGWFYDSCSIIAATMR